MGRTENCFEASRAGYNHTQAFQEAFGVHDASWFLAKADRELAQYFSATDAAGRLDALMNFCSSVIALEDWALPTDATDEGAWRGGLRSGSPAHACIVLIALVAKHRRLRDQRFSSLRFETGRIEAWSEDPSARRILDEIRRVTPSARILAVRTHIDDDQIEGYTVTIEVEGLVHEGKLTPLEDVMREALSFWQMRLNP